MPQVRHFDRRVPASTESRCANLRDLAVESGGIDGSVRGMPICLSCEAPAAVAAGAFFLR